MSPMASVSPAYLGLRIVVGIEGKKIFKLLQKRRPLDHDTLKIP